MTVHRARALFDQAFDAMEREAASGKRDHVARLVDAYHGDPLAYLERVHKMMGAEQGNGGSTLNINGLFLQAVMAANGHTAQGKVIDADPVGVPSGLADTQPIDNEW